MTGLYFTLGQHWIDHYLSCIILLHTLLGHDTAVTPKGEPTPETLVHILQEVATRTYDPAKYFNAGPAQRLSLTDQPPPLTSGQRYALINLNASTARSESVSVPAGGIVFEDPVWAILAAHALSKNLRVAIPIAKDNDELWKNMPLITETVQHGTYKPQRFLGLIGGFIPPGTPARFELLSVDSDQIAALRDRGIQSFPVTASLKFLELFQLPLKLVRPRSHHCAILLTDTTVLTTGGISPDEQAISMPELLALATGRRMLAAGHHLPRVEHCCVKLMNGRVLLIGGLGAGGKPEARIEVFDPSTREFSRLGSLETARVHHQAVLLLNGQVLVTGGLDSDGNALSSAELINPSTAEVTELEASMNSRRYHHVAQLLDNGLVLITGGDGDTNSRLSAELYHPREKVFLPPIDMHIERSTHTATLLDDSRVFIFSNGIGEIFDPETRRFIVVPGEWGPKTRTGHTATVLSDGSVLILGGGKSESSEELIGAPLIYDPKKNSYTELDCKDELINRAGHAAVRLKDGVVLITGGRTSESLATNDIFVYDPNTQRFSAYAVGIDWSWAEFEEQDEDW